MLQALKNFLGLIVGKYRYCFHCKGYTYTSDCCHMPTKKFWRRYEKSGQKHWVHHYQCTECGQFCKEIPCGDCDGTGLVQP